MIKKALLIVGASLFLLSVLLTIVAQSSYIQDKLQTIVVREIKNNTNLDFKAGEIRMVLFPPAVSIKNAALDVPGIGTANIPQTFIKIDHSSLIRGKLVLRSIRLISPKISIQPEKEQIDASPETNPVEFTTIFNNAQNLPIKELLIEDGELEWKDHEIKSHIASLSVIKKRHRFLIKTSIEQTKFKYKNSEFIVDRLMAVCGVEEHRLRLQRGAFNGPWGKLEASGVIWGKIFGNSDTVLESEMDLKIESSLNLTSIPKLTPTLETTSGDLYLNGNLKNRIADPLFSGRIEGTGVVLNVLTLPKFTGDIETSKKAVRLNPLILNVEDGEISINGMLKPEEHWALEGVATFRKMPVGSFLKSFDVQTDPVRADLSGAISAVGTLEPVNLSYNASLEVEKFGVGAGEDVTQFDEGIVEVNGIIDSEKITFENGNVNVNNGGEISAKGYINFTGPLRFDYFTDRFQLSALHNVGEIPISGIAKVVGSVTDAPTKRTIAESTVRIESFSIANYNVGWIRSNLMFAKNILTMKTANVRKGESEYTFNGSVDVDAGEFTESKFTFKKLNYDDLRETIEYHLALPEWIEGELSGIGIIDGPPTIDGIKASANLIMIKPVIAGEQFDSGSFIFNVKDGTLTLDKSMLKKSKSEVVLTGSTKLNKSLAFQFYTNNASYGDFTILKKHKVPLDGNLEARGAISGPWAEPKGSGEIIISQVSLAGEPLPASNIKLELKKKKLTAGWSLENHEMTMHSSLILDGEYPFNISIASQEYRIDPFLSLISKAENRLKGTMQGTITAEGTLSPFYLKNGDLDLDKIQIRHGSLIFQNRDNVKAVVRDGKTIINPFHLVGKQTDLIMSGTISQTSNMDMKLNGSFDLFLLEFFVKPITRATGTGVINAQVAGPIKKPELLGGFSIQQAALKTTWLPQPIEQINAEIVFSRRLVSIEKWNAKWGGGPINVIGTIANPADAPLIPSIHLISRNNHLEVLPGLYTKFSSDLHLAGKDQPYLLSGNIDLQEAVYKEKVRWQSNLFQTKQYHPQVIREEIPLIAFDVALNAKKGVRIDNNLAQILFKGDLKIIGDMERPNLKGEMTLVEGKSFFRDTEFTMTTGEIDFADPLEINPYINLRAESKVRNYQISVAMSGYLGDYDVQLSSQPPLSEGDIVALLTLGFTSEDVAGQEGQFAALELGSILFGGVSEAIEREMGRNIGITFRVTPSYSTTRGATVPKVIVGTELFKDIEASFASSIGESAFLGDKEARVEYKINNNLSLQGVWEDQLQAQQLDESKIGVDVKYQFEFR